MLETFRPSIQSSVEVKGPTFPAGSSWVKFLTKPYGVVKDSILEAPSVNLFPQQDTQAKENDHVFRRRAGYSVGAAHEKFSE